MDYSMITHIVGAVLMAVVGYFALYLKTRGDLLSMVSALIAQAEEEYNDVTKAGGQKFVWVCDKLYAGIPTALKPFISYEDVERMVQATFDEVEAYANKQLNGFVDKFADEIYNSAAD